MRDHFLKTILPNIDDYGLNAEQKKMLQSGATGSSEECNNITFMWNKVTVIAFFVTDLSEIMQSNL